MAFFLIQAHYSLIKNPASLPCSVRPASRVANSFAPKLLAFRPGGRSG